MTVVEPAVAVVAIVIVFVAAMVQRLTGMGFALVATPVLVILFGPVNGVLIELVTGTFVSLVMLALPGSRGGGASSPGGSSPAGVIHWPRALKLTASAVAAMPLGLLLIFVLPSGWLMILVACAAAFSLWWGMRPRVTPKPEGVLDVYLTGVTTGILHITSGLSGPPMVGYALKTRWDQRQFIMSMQVVFVCLTVASLVLRGLPSIPLELMAWLLLSALGGTLLATALNRFIPVRVVRIFMLVVSWTGTVTVLVRGVLEAVGA